MVTVPGKEVDRRAVRGYVVEEAEEKVLTEYIDFVILIGLYLF